MPVLIIQRMPPQFSTETYDAVNEKAGIGENPPEGLIAHTLGTSADGAVIVDIWESADHHESFRTGRLNPALEEVVGSEMFAAMPTPDRQFFEIHNSYQA
jgi:hypothetical protein